MAQHIQYSDSYDAYFCHQSLKHINETNWMVMLDPEEKGYLWQIILRVSIPVYAVADYVAPKAVLGEIHLDPIPRKHKAP